MYSGVNALTDHFSDEQWSDFVRGAASADLRPDMEAHLQSGCAACAGTAAAFESVMRVAEADLAWPVPQESVNQAKALFEEPPERNWIEALKGIRGRLLPEIANDWRLAGARSGGAEVEPADERLLFQAGPYTVDLKLDRPAAGEAGEIIGQISGEPSHSDSLGGVLVQLISGPGHTLGETTTNRFGEFFVEYSGQKNVMLRFALRTQNQRIDVALKSRRRSAR